VFESRRPDQKFLIERPFRKRGTAFRFVGILTLISYSNCQRSGDREAFARGRVAELGSFLRFVFSGGGGEGGGWVDEAAALVFESGAAWTGFVASGFYDSDRLLSGFVFAFWL
jgi:hypothetical protein